MARAQPASAAAQGPELGVVLFNVHSSDEDVTEGDRQNCLKVVLKSVVSSKTIPDPLFLLCQEKITTPKHEILCQKLGQQPKAIRCQEEAGVYYRLSETADDVDVRYIGVSKLLKIEDGMGLEAGVPFEVARLMACVLTLPDSEDCQKILLVSWHGPETKAKKNMDLKRTCFRRLIRFCECLRWSEACTAVVIGGDFNLPAESARQMMKSFQKDLRLDGAVLDNYTPPSDRQGLGIIDFIVYWPQNKLQCLKTRVIRPKYRREMGNRPFDHPIVAYTFGNMLSEAGGKDLSKVTQQTLLPEAVRANPNTSKATDDAIKKVAQEFFKVAQRRGKRRSEKAAQE